MLEIILFSIILYICIYYNNNNRGNMPYALLILQKFGGKAKQVYTKTTRTKETTFSVKRYGLSSRIF